MPFGKALRLLHTARHLRPIQVYWRLWLKLAARLPHPMSGEPPRPVEHFGLTAVPTKPKSNLGGSSFRFLNREVDFGARIDWNAPEEAKLWLYNLHYFDFANLAGANPAAILALMEDWIEHNPPGRGNGWEPYPTSLRLVNWIKFFAATDIAPSDSVLQSLHRQAWQLRHRLEYHLLGNHLFKNGVALVYAGSWFTGATGDEWLDKGVEIVDGQLREQVLPDGGHFERSPMYHTIVLEDLLDAINVGQTTGRVAPAVLADWCRTACAMTTFLRDTLHMDGEIAFFNDSALGIATPPAQLLAYAERLGIPTVVATVTESAGLTATAKPQFGLYALDLPGGRMLIDAGPIGPDYLPGHAHCDTLSYEVSIAGRRVLVNSGTFQYAGDRRNEFRATAAHNTVRVDGTEQHEIWSTFRVARRGYPMDIRLESVRDGWQFQASHSGYRRLTGNPVHRRQVHLTGTGWTVCDTVEGSGTHRIEVFIHLHPDFKPQFLTDGSVELIIDTYRLRIAADRNCTFRQEAYEYSPEFGALRPASRLLLALEGTLPITIGHSIQLNACAEPEI